MIKSQYEALMAGHVFDFIKHGNYDQVMIWQDHKFALSD